MSDGSSAKDAAWAALEAQAKADAGGRIAALFDAEPDRLQRLTLEAAGLFLDLSKQPWSRAGFDAALALARAGDVEGHRARLFAGEMVNRTEQRPALHMALRAPDGAAYTAEGKPVSPEVEATRGAMQAFAEGVRAGRIVGATGKPFRTIVHIGIGGSDLGPKLVWEALKPLEPPIDLRFVANIDGAEIAAALAGLDPAETLVIVVSKSFTTEETLVNGNAARAWLARRARRGRRQPAPGGGQRQRRGRRQVRRRHGPRLRLLGLGRRALFAVVGGGALDAPSALGWDVFAQLLAGGAAMDEHFRTTPLERNAPALLALAHVFNRNGLGRPIRAVVPYARRLALLPAFLQQLEMELNGKRVTEAGSR